MFYFVNYGNCLLRLISEGVHAEIVKAYTREFGQTYYNKISHIVFCKGFQKENIYVHIEQN